jgi:hypothetical protein
VASLIVPFLDDKITYTLVSELSDPNRSLPNQTGIPSRELTQSTLDSFLANWAAALVASGQPDPASLTTDNASPADAADEAPQD